jgi:hypothetical protein
MPTQESIPSAEQAARRALALAAVVCRSGIEQNAGDPEAESFRVEVLEWLDTAGVASSLEPEELEMLEAPLGTLTEQQEKNAGWRAEGLGVLAWALNRWELDPFYTPTDAPTVAEALGFMEPEGLELLKSPKLRSESEREKLARQLYLIHMRLRQAYDKEPGSRNAAQLAMELKVNSVDLDLVDDDLAISDVPLTEVPSEVIRYTISTVAERHRAANWLLGDNPAYSEVSYSLRGAQ